MVFNLQRLSLSDFGVDLERFRESFWRSFWDQIGPRGAKMSPIGPSRAPKYRKPTFAKTLKNHWFFNVFGGPRTSKTASEDPRRLPRGYLGLLGAILSHLGAILKTRAIKIAPAKNRCEGGSPSCSILGSILGPEIGPFLVILGAIF